MKRDQQSDWKRLTTTLGILLLLGGLALAGNGQAQGGPIPFEQLVDPGAPALGPESAKVVIVEFSDFQCPYCAKASNFVLSLQEEYSADVKVIWMDRPLTGKVGDGFPLHPYAMLAHEAAAEAQVQGKFWEMEKWIFSHQKTLFKRPRPTSPEQLAAQLEEIRTQLLGSCEELELSKRKMEKALTKHTRLETVERRLAMAKAISVNSTPTFFVDGVEAGSNPKALRRAVEMALGVFKPIPAEALIDPGAPALGPESAPVVIVEFSDFQCPYCSGAARRLHTLQAKAPEDIRLVWMDRPLTETMDDGMSFHPYAMIAHEAAAEAAAQGRFWPMQEWIFGRQKKLFNRERPESEDELKAQLAEIQAQLVAAAAELELDAKKMEEALADHRRRETIERRLKMGLAQGVTGTPTIFVNGVEMENEQDLLQSVEKALGRPLPEDD